MADIRFFEVNTPDQIHTVAQLGREIWGEHYAELLGPQQIAYMLEKYQSEQAVSRQLAEEGYRYWLVVCNGKPCGYCGFVKEKERLFLSKLYLLKQVRGQGIARKILGKLCEEAVGLRAIYLTVNKHNDGSIAVYQKMGFQTIDAVTTDIGNGYVMDDYIMELPISG